MSMSAQSNIVQFPSYSTSDTVSAAESSVRSALTAHGPTALMGRSTARQMAVLRQEDGMRWGMVCDLLAEDPRSKKKLTDIRRFLTEAERAYAVELRSNRSPANDDTDPTDWRQSDRWLLSAKGVPLACEANVMHALRSAPDLVGRFRWNLLANQTRIVGQLPWRGEPNRTFVENDATYLVEWLQLAGMTGIDPQTAWRGVDTVARESAFHPVKDYLSSLTWDGTARIEGMVAGCLNAEDLNISRVFLRKWLVSAVARIFEPGCQADHMLILEGDQGARKTTFFKLLGGEWYTGSIRDMGDKDSKMLLGKFWIIEVAELAALDKRDAKTVKQEITIRDDDYRLPYARAIESFPRQMVWAGTNNPEELGTFKDDTGARRFWPITVGEINTVWLEANRDQVWAEAVSLYRGGETWYLDEKQDQIDAKETQDDRTVSHHWEPQIWSYLEGDINQYAEGSMNKDLWRGEIQRAASGEKLRRDRVTIAEIMTRAFEKPITVSSKSAESYVIAGILRKFGFRNTRMRDENGHRYSIFVRQGADS